MIILPGTKIIVVASNLEKGKTGTKVGSIGFFTKSMSCNIIHDNEDGNRPPLFVSCSRIYFNRYGFEQNDRVELKDVINILPIKTDRTNKRRTFTKWMDGTIDIMIKSERARSKAAQFGSHDGTWTTFVIGACDDIGKISLNTWLCWCSSMIMSSHVTEVLSSTTKRNMLCVKFPPIKKWLDTLYELSVSREKRIELLKSIYLYRDVTKASELIMVLRTIVQSYELLYSKSQVEELRGHLINGRILIDKGKGIEKVIKDIYKYIAHPYYDYIRTSITSYTNSYSSSNGNNIIENAEYLRRWVCSPPPLLMLGEKE